MFTLIKQADVYAPESMGVKDVLITAGTISKVADHIELPTGWGDVDVIDAKGKKLVPGFIDGHVHILGGGGEGGYHTRTPELMLSDAIKAGVTSVIGVIGTDGTTRTMASLVAKANGLEAEGVTCYCLTGNYHVPVRTLMDSVEDDILLVDRIIGSGEIAIADHRSSQPTVGQLAKIASQSRVGGMLSGKSGIVNVHVGGGDDQLSLLEEVIETTNVPIQQFIPTHMNRSASLLEAGIEFAKKGGRLDFTTSTVPKFLEEGEVTCGQALKTLLDEGIDIEQITFTSDAQGSLPTFDEHGHFVGLKIGRMDSLFEAVRDAVLTQDIALSTALKVVTTSPAQAFQLDKKGEIIEGNDADFVMLDEQLHVDTVIARGKVMMEGGEVIVRGTFE
ncbi:beta-aspartyl-peptidase [Texcoconibacillus texcoconensis]|uniref:Isoaspartyl dipeptidase n=1 Tax=Texcoconibacillus texcoconensis TaxID=1095777 RepID=A0A840QIS1_9BACI|nr:beta-aspartyl-peptidase [Texcoconibacillus texcoconensis]MBB5171995.1 beta-aspartyl-dipeptidase (metallo-type) [Texcoconibacillus texcoconensis]